jgi:Terminase large subunit, T4likevirus-type, N-terminal
MDRSPRRLIVKARQIGFSQAIALEAAHEAIFRPDSTILLVSRSGDLADNLLGYCYTAIAGLDDIPTLTKTNESEMGFANGSRIKSLPANRSTARGFAGRSVYLDEYAYMDVAEEIYRGVSPIVGHGGRLTVCSTPDGRGNHFYQLFAGIDGGVWSRHIVPWQACPVYDQAWFDRERPKYTAQQWASEYGCDFVASGQAVFDAADVEACADGWKGLQPPTLGRTYVSAWDIGRRADATVGITLDVTNGDFQVVAYERLLGVPFPVQQRAIEARAKAYGGDTYVESNNQGDPVIENLTVPVFAWTTTARTKEAAITSLVLAHEQRRFKHGVAQLKHECLLYQWIDQALIQDSVITAAIAVHCAAHEAPVDEFVVYDDPVTISPY